MLAYSKGASAAWRKILPRTMLAAFALVLLICSTGCVSPSPADPPFTGGIQQIRKGEAAPADGYWISRRMLLMLYEAAERGVADMTKSKNRVPLLPLPADTQGKAPGPTRLPQRQP